MKKTYRSVYSWDKPTDLRQRQLETGKLIQTLKEQIRVAKQKIVDNKTIADNNAKNMNTATVNLQ